MRVNECSLLNDKMSSTNLYIRGLPSYFNEQTLQELIPNNEIIKSVKIAKDETDKCKGYGFIDFVTKQNAIEAKEYLELNYSIYPVKFAKENEKDRTNLYVSNLPRDWTSSDSDKLREIFEKFGYVQSAFIMVERSTNKPTGIGFVRYSVEENATKALNHFQHNRTVITGSDRALEVKHADKHSPESRKRRSSLNSALVEPVSSSYLQNQNGAKPNSISPSGDPLVKPSSLLPSQTPTTNPFILQNNDLMSLVPNQFIPYNFVKYFPQNHFQLESLLNPYLLPSSNIIQTNESNIFSDQYVSGRQYDKTLNNQFIYNRDYSMINHNTTPFIFGDFDKSLLDNYNNKCL